MARHEEHKPQLRKVSANMGSDVLGPPMYEGSTFIDESIFCFQGDTLTAQTSPSMNLTYFGRIARRNQRSTPEHCSVHRYFAAIDDAGMRKFSSSWCGPSLSPVRYLDARQRNSFYFHV